MKVWKPLTLNQRKLLSKLGEFLHGSEFDPAFSSIASYDGCAIDEQIFSLRRHGQARGEQRTHPLPVEGRFTDSDGQPVFVWVFCSADGQLAEIEFWKPSGATIHTSPFEADVTVGTSSGRR